MLERLTAAMSGAITGAVNGWKQGPAPVPLDTLQHRYMERWSLYSGELFSTFLRENPHRSDPSVYPNVKLLWKHAEAVVDFYAGVIYQGALSTDGKPLPDGTPPAIPLAPQTGDKTAGDGNRDTVLIKAIAELWSAWNWQQQMSLRPMYGAALGDVLTELVDDTERRFVYPEIVWPGHVKDIELDYVGNVRGYTLEYMVQEEHPDGSSDTYRYRKEVDREAFRHFKDDKPWDRYGTGSVVPNPYGFVPAIWDRHRIAAPGHVRGKAALDGTRQALLTLNSLFAHAFDHQRKVFYAPIMVTGQVARRGETEVNLSQPVTAASQQDEIFKVVRVASDANILQPQFDIGQTREMLADLREGILAENPEASFYQQMREMQQVTAPGAERLMGDVKNRVDLARAGYDAQTVKLFQMALAIAGMRVNDGSWSRVSGRRIPLTRRQLAFTRFDLQSFDRGEMDFSIQSRPLVIPTESERLAIIAQKEALLTSWGMTQAGVPETDITAIQDERRERFTTSFNGGAFGADYEEAG